MLDLRSAPASDEMLFILCGVLLVVNSWCMMSPDCVWVNELINLSGCLYQREGVGHYPAKLPSSSTWHKSLSRTEPSHETFSDPGCLVLPCFWGRSCHCGARDSIMQHFCDASVATTCRILKHIDLNKEKTLTLNTHQHSMDQINLLKVKQKRPLTEKATVTQERRSKIPLCFYFTDFFEDFIASLNQYSIWIVHGVMSTVGPFKCDTWIHVFKWEQKLGITTQTLWSYVWWFTEQLYRTLCDTQAMQWIKAPFTFSPAG